MVFIGDEIARCAPAPSNGMEQRMQKRRRFKQTQSLEERLAVVAKMLRRKAAMLPQGRLRDVAERKARQVDTASHLSQWLRSPGLRTPD